MKNSLTMLSILLAASIFFAGCNDDDGANNPEEPDTEDTYFGFIRYADDGNEISTQDGEVTVTHDGNTYSFDFSDDIPDLDDVEMRQQDDILINVDVDRNGVVKIVDNGRELVIGGYVRDGAEWNADCRNQ